MSNFSSTSTAKSFSPVLLSIHSLPEKSRKTLAMRLCCLLKMKSRVQYLCYLALSLIFMIFDMVSTTSCGAPAALCCCWHGGGVGRVGRGAGPGVCGLGGPVGSRGKIACEEPVRACGSEGQVLLRREERSRGGDGGWGAAAAA